MEFNHLHVHTQFSLLDGAADISKLLDKAKTDGMRAMAITDHGNMFGVFKFVAEAAKKGIKPIIGCEFYLVEDRFKKQFTKENKDIRYHQLLLAKDEIGYQNLIKLCSIGYIDGLYSKWPRIDKQILLEHHQGLIATTCCLGAEVPKAIMNKSEDEAEELFKWWLGVFGEDYYVEIQRHGLSDQDKVNEVLLRFAKKHNVKIIASNDSHYVNKEDATAHDILLCVNTGDKKSTPIATDEEGGKGFRFGFSNDEFYFKTKDEMLLRFSDIPESLDNTGEIVDKIKTLNIKRDILVPHFPLPAPFTDADEYLRHLTFEGARKRYLEITPEIEERLNFELYTIKTMGFPGYFLIVSDFIKAGRDMGVLIGPGRGSAAGSAVAYCIGITNIDPIKYNLLFERFLNPERKSMPDIDTDFDDVGRQKVLDYVIDKYGKNQVAQIINYGTMAARSSIKDVARVLDLPLNESNELAKLVPERPNIKLKDAIEEVPALKVIFEGSGLKSEVLKEAMNLEGSVRNTGIHASAVIIAPNDLMEHLPLSVAKDSNLWVTQWDGSVIESAGLLKMDFLGLKTLSIINDSINLISQNQGVEIIPDEIPLDDPLTYQLFQNGETISVFQFESDGMQKYLKDLKPDKFEDIIAMVALFRPGPMNSIPNFIKRKHGQEEITYDFPITEDLLSDTYGITIYQEQVMLLSQKLAGFSKGDADVLRKAMGKKQMDVLQQMKDKFIEGCKNNGHNVKIAEKVWKDWEAFAHYAFNKSHATCYAYVAFQTAYLKAHYPAEFMAAVLNAQINTEQIAFFMEECKRMGISVLGPDINESMSKFTVNNKVQIRFGLSALKGVGEAAVENIVEERKNGGHYQSIFDLCRRINHRAVNKKVFEGLAYGGAFDSWGNIHRAQYFNTEKNDQLTFIEKAIKYGQNYQENLNSAQASLFDSDSEVSLPEPSIPNCEPWSFFEQLKYEQGVIGMYISGHPLQDYAFELRNYCRNKVIDLLDEKSVYNKDITIGAIVNSVFHGVSKEGKPYGKFTIEDETGKFEISLNGERYLKWKTMFAQDGLFVYIKFRLEPWSSNIEKYSINISNMFLLSEASEKLTKQIDLYVNLNDIDDKFIDNLIELIKNNSGQCNLQIRVNHTDESSQVELRSIKHKVSLSKEFVSYIEDRLKLKYSLN
ncbi:MAG: DNA polymerase III subunit alpha [Bacteroidia bacterium]|nr:DNA polymerase III subunit alpha [Bacteroidia bacterium]MCZ2247885.1 DNA polymerase III subunit alpha [Bacteroidia bacterium]